MHATSRALVAVALAASPAAAKPARTTTPSPRPWTGYVRVPRVAPPAAAVSSRIVYVKRCDPGCQVHYAPVDDSRTGASSIVPDGTTRTIGGFKQPITVWNDMMECVRQTFAPFDITVTDVAPPSGTPHFLNLVGGVGTDVNPDFTNAGGVAPFDCGEIPNAITYTFDVYGPDAVQLCWTVSQEVAHAFGLDHEFLQKDPMTYVGGDLPKRFRDVDAPCGELEQRPCNCPGGMQNSYREIVTLFGPGAPTPPMLEVKYPTDGTQTQPGFTAVATATDDVRVERVELYVDGAKLVEATAPAIRDDFELVTPDIAQGPHTLEIRAIDVQGVTESATLSFTQGPPCTPSTVCSGTDVCVSGICVPGPDAPGGLGAICNEDSECLSHRCADAGEPQKHCVDECELADGDSCPNDFDCVPAGAMGVCWPAPEGGCCDATGGPEAPMLLALGLGVLVLRRRPRER